MQFIAKQNEILAVLFAAGEPLEISKICQVLEMSNKELIGTIGHLNDRLKQLDLPFEIRRLGDNIQMCASAKYSDIIREALTLRKQAPLSQAAMEVLAIVAYNQPVTRAFIENLRGVESGRVISGLIEKELIEEAGRLDLPGRPIAYRTTAHFLRCFSMETLDELPKVDSEHTEQLSFDQSEEKSAVI